MRKLIILFISIAIFQGCPTVPKDCNSDYCFEAPISITPAKSEYKIGDTILVSMDMDNTMIRDTAGDRIVSIPNYDPNIHFQFPSLDTFPIKDGFLVHDIIIPTKYKTSLIPISTLSYGLLFLEIDTSRERSKLDFKIVLKSSGLYCLYAGSAVNVNSWDIDFEDKCGPPSDYTIWGVCKYTNDINLKILNDKNREVEDKYWEKRGGARIEDRPYYFRVIE